jgi:LmbE family N-acetylglucosaminyl deacetylase
LNIDQLSAFVFVPDAVDEQGALSRSTHLAIGAHPDDLELIGIHGISACMDRDDRWFSGVVVTDGAGSARSGRYSSMSDGEIAEIRKQEQIDAAHLGQYSMAIQLGYASSALLGGFCETLIEALRGILDRSQPETLYLHNPVDRHATHVAVCLHAIEALRRLDSDHRPEEIFGVEVWRSLDWVSSSTRLVLDVSDADDIQQRLLSTYKSQLEGGKRYDVAIRARNVANATFSSEREVDSVKQGSYALDLMPLVRDRALTVTGYVASLMAGMKLEIASNLVNFEDD